MYHTSALMIGAQNLKQNLIANFEGSRHCLEVFSMHHSTRTKILDQHGREHSGSEVHINNLHFRRLQTMY